MGGEALRVDPVSSAMLRQACVVTIAGEWNHDNATSKCRGSVREIERRLMRVVFEIMVDDYRPPQGLMIDEIYEMRDER